MSIQVEINDRFCGPPTSGNGGYVCGVIANFVGPSAKVRLMAPPPLNETLSIHRVGQGIELRGSEVLYGTGEESDFELTLPPTPSVGEAKEAQTRFIAFHDHLFPGCFVCGPHRKEGDGLRIFPGPILVDDWNVLACVWRPSSDLFDDKGLLRHEFIWASLDCPTCFAAMGARTVFALLGEMTLRIVSEVDSAAPLIVWCWPIESNGRKHVGGAALATADGRLIAYAKGLWIELKA